MKQQLTIKSRLVIYLIIGTVISLMISIITVSLYFKAGETIVYVDAVKLLSGYSGMKEARKDYESKTDKWKTNLDSLRAELDVTIKDYQSKQMKLGAKEKKIAEGLVQAKQQTFLNYQRIISEKMQKEDQELTTQVIGKVNDYIKKYGKRHDYKIIMAATKYGNIVYSSEDTDITEPILEGLNREYKKTVE